MVEDQKTKTFKPPFQGERCFCLGESNMTYDVKISGNDIIISSEKIKIKVFLKMDYFLQTILKKQNTGITLENTITANIME